MNEHLVLSTKQLSGSQKELFLHSGFHLVDYDAIAVEFLDFEAPEAIENAIFTSQNAVSAYLSNKEPKDHIENCFCVGEKTKALLVKNGQKIVETAKNASFLAKTIINNDKNASFYYFCGSRKREELPNILKKAKIDVFEVKTYHTKLKSRKFDQKWAGILFFSPSGVESYVLENTVGKATVFCIGETTASEARKHTDNVVIANATTVENVLTTAVKKLKEQHMT